MTPSLLRNASLRRAVVTLRKSVYLSFHVAALFQAVVKKCKTVKLRNFFGNEI